MKVTIAKALNMKNRLVGEKERLFQLFRHNNSRVADTKTNYDPKQLLADYEAAVDKLVAVKTAVAKANVAIYDKIYRIAELKSKVAQLRAVNTNDKDEETTRMVRGADGHYVDEPKTIKHIAHLNDVAMEQKIKGLESEIEGLQDSVTAFNHTETVEVPE